MDNEVMQSKVEIELGELLGLMKKAEQRDVMLRYVAHEKYSVDKQTLFCLCGEEFPKDMEDD